MRFDSIDRTLDKADKGPLWLKDARVAKCVVEAFHYGERGNAIV